ncbi:MAG: flagellin lysine-N-methylase [Clostridia bacterium]|nr:flagellin lysine-N-methylase [Clostridia bacterium]
MKTYAPGYYKKFKCIADKCKNNCCIGWEIDIDTQTFEEYQKVKGDLGDRLQSCISDNAEGERHFVLDGDERCPFLNKNNLCDIYAGLGEESLCDICRDHPRYRNFYDCRTEVGLGLCCEAAVDLVLDWQEVFSLVVVDEDEEAEGFDDLEEVFFSLRDKAFEIIQNQGMSAEECVDVLLETFGQSADAEPFENRVGVYLSLEILDGEWKKMLEESLTCKKFDYDIFKSREGQNIQRQLLLYFVYRHTAEGIYDGCFGAWVRFAVLGLEMIKALCAASEKPSIVCFKDIARRYSSEIEYSEENTKRLLNLLCMT